MLSVPIINNGLYSLHLLFDRKFLLNSHVPPLIPWKIHILLCCWYRKQFFFLYLEMIFISCVCFYLLSCLWSCHLNVQKASHLFLCIYFTFLQAKFLHVFPFRIQIYFTWSWYIGLVHPDVKWVGRGSIAFI